MRKLILLLLPLFSLSGESNLSLWLDEPGKALIAGYQEDYLQRSIQGRELHAARIALNNHSTMIPMGAAVQLDHRDNLQGETQLSMDMEIWATILSNTTAPNEALLEHELRRSEASMDWQLQRMTHGLLLFALQVERQKDILEVEQQTQDTLDGQVRALESLFQRNRITYVEMESALARLHRSQANLAQQELAYSIALSQLQQQLADSWQLFLTSIEWSDLLGFAPQWPENNIRSDLLMLQQHQEILSIQLDRAYLAGFPQVRLSAGLGGSPDSLQWNASLKLSYSLDQLKEKQELIDRLSIEENNQRESYLWQLTQEGDFFLQADESYRMLTLSYQACIQAETHSLNALEGIEQEYLSGLSTSQDYLAAMENHRILSKERRIAYWDLMETALYRLYLSGGLQL